MGNNKSHALPFVLHHRDTVYLPWVYDSIYTTTSKTSYWTQSAEQRLDQGCVAHSMDIKVPEEMRTTTNEREENTYYLDAMELTRHEITVMAEDNDCPTCY